MASNGVNEKWNILVNRRDQNQIFDLWWTLLIVINFTYFFFNNAPKKIPMNYGKNFANITQTVMVMMWLNTGIQAAFAYGQDLHTFAYGQYLAFIVWILIVTIVWDL